MSFKDELTTEVKSVRKKIKTEAINYFIGTIKKEMKNVAMRGITKGSISLRTNFEDCEEYEDDDTEDVELYRLNKLLLITKERELESIEIYRWLIKQVNKTGVFQDINITLNIEEFELEFYWYIEESESEEY